MRFYYQETINLVKPKTGEEIIHQMRLMNSSLYRERMNRGDPPTFKIGFSGGPSREGDVVILTGEHLDQERIAPTEEYRRIAVGTGDWEEPLRRTVVLTQKDFERRVKKTAENLGKRLNSL